MLKTLTNLLWAVTVLLVAGAIAFAIVVPTVGIGVQAGAVVDSAATQLAAPTNTPLPPAGVLLTKMVSRVRQSEYVSAAEMTTTVVVEVSQDNGAVFGFPLPQTKILATVYGIVHAGYKSDAIVWDIRDNVVVITLPAPVVLGWELDRQETSDILQPLEVWIVSVGAPREETLDYLAELSKEKSIAAACNDGVLAGTNSVAESYFRDNFAAPEEASMLRVTTTPPGECAK